MRQPDSCHFLLPEFTNKGSAKLKAAEPHMYFRLSTF